jgi:hypothetical protein
MYEMITRRNRKKSKRITRRKKVDESPPGCISKYLLSCIDTFCVDISEYDIIPDIYFKEKAYKLLEIIDDIYNNDIFSQEVSIYMKLGYNSMIDLKYRLATIYFNKALDCV